MDIQLPARSSLRDFLHILFKRKAQILLIFLATVCTVTIGTFVIRPTYEAKAQILVKIGRENLYIPPNSTNSQVINFFRDEQINSEIELISSRALAEKVTKSLGPKTILGPESIFYKFLDILMGVIDRLFQRSQANTSLEKAVLKFQKSLSIEGINVSDVISIRFRHKDPETAAIIVNTLTDFYFDEHLLVHRNPKSYNFFEQQSQDLNNKLSNSEAMLKSFKKINNITDMEGQQRLLLNQISELRAELNRTLSQEAETKNRTLQIRQQLNITPKTVPQGEEADHNPILISSLEARLVELQLKEKKLLIKYTPQSRLVINVKEEIKFVQNKLAEQENKRYGKSQIGPNTTHQRLIEELYRNQAESKALAGKKEIQNSQLDAYQNSLENLNQMEVELNQLQQVVDVNRQNYRLYLAKFEESRISDAMDNKKIINVSLMEKALSPFKPIKPKKILNIVLGVFLGTFGGLGLAFFMEYLDDSLETPEQIESALKLPVLASVPELKT